TGIADLLHCRSAVAPFRMHLQIAAILLNRGSHACGVGENAPDCRPADKVLPKLTPPFDVCPPSARCDRILDRRRLAAFQNLADDAYGTWTNARDSREGTVAINQIGQGCVEREDRRRRPFVSE